MNKNYRIFYLDFIRVISIFLVMFIHVSAIDTTLNIGTGQWQIIKILNYFAHISVPLFFMISGALLLTSRKTSSLSYTWSHRIPRIMIPFLIWSIIYPFAASISTNSFSLNDIFITIRNILNHPTSPILWFMYPLIGVYILSPIIKTFIKSANMQMLIYTVFIWLITCSIIPSIAVLLPKNYQQILTLSPVASFLLVGGFPGYFVLGYLLTKLKPEKINNLILMFVFLITGLTGSFVSQVIPNVFDSNNGYYVTSIWIPIMSTTAFILLRKLGNKITNLSVIKFFEFLSPLVFGIYLFHDLVIINVEPLLMRTITIHGVIATLMRYFIVAVLSIGIIWILNLIPVISYALLGNKSKKKKVNNIKK